MKNKKISIEVIFLANELLPEITKIEIYAIILNMETLTNQTDRRVHIKLISDIKED